MRIASAGKLSDSIKELKAQSGAFLTTLMATHGENPAVEGAGGSSATMLLATALQHAVYAQLVGMALCYMLLAVAQHTLVCTQWT